MTSTASTTVTDIGPLDWRIGIVDSQGRPTPEFQRRWNTQRSNNGLIIPITIGTGAPETPPVPVDGAEYIDIGASPPVLYTGSSGSWVKVGVYTFTQLTDVPNSYASAAHNLVRVNTGQIGLEFEGISGVLDDIGSTQGDLLYRDTSIWKVLSPGTSGQLLKSGGASANPSWENISTAIDSLGATQGDILYRSATGWTVLTPGTSGQLLATGGASANPTWEGITTALDTLGSTQGDIIYRGSTGWVVLTPGISGQLLQTGGTAANPSWVPAPSGAVGANPTATASDTAVNGTATTFLRSDGAPAVQKASASVFGIVKVDGSTITASGGVITAVGGGGGGGDVTKIATVITSGSQATVTFASIPATYQHLEIDAVLQTSGSSTSDQALNMTINSDASNIYSTSGSGTVGFGTTSSHPAQLGFVSSGSGTVSNSSNYTIYINGYKQTSLNKSWTVLYGGFGGTPYSGNAYGQWANTTAITQLDFTLGGGLTFSNGSVFTLYGKN